MAHLSARVAQACSVAASRVRLSGKLTHALPLAVFACGDRVNVWKFGFSCFPDSPREKGKLDSNVEPAVGAASGFPLVRYGA